MQRNGCAKLRAELAMERLRANLISGGIAPRGKALDCKGMADRRCVMPWKGNDK